MKELGLYTVTFTTLLIAIIIPVEWGFWWGVARGILLYIFIYLIPVWVKFRNERS